MHTDSTGVMRQKILAEAARLFVANGYNGISMREIAAACGLSKPGLYYHFKDKEDLFVALLRQNLDGLNANIEACLDPGLPFREQVDVLIRAIFSQSPEQRSLIRVAGQEMIHLDPQTRAAFAADYHHLFLGKIAAVLERGMQAGELRRMDPMRATWVLLGMLYPFFTPSSASPEDEEQVLGTVISIFLDGLAV